MNNKVKVTAKDGKVIIPSENKPEFGFIRVESENQSMENGWARVETRSALIRGTIKDLTKLNLKEGDAVAGKIIVKESTSSTNPKAEAKINPSTGATITHQGMPVYRESFYTSVLSAQDELLASDKVMAEVSALEKAASEAL